MLAKKQLSNVPLYQPGKPIEEVKKELGLDEIIKLASNENPFGYSPAVKEAIDAEMEDLPIYPNGGSTELKEAMAKFLNVSEDSLIFGNGSDELVHFIGRTYLQPGTNTVMATHTFPLYLTSGMIEDSQLHQVPLKDGVHDLETMLAKVDENTRVVWICNPNNPTGTMVSEEQLTSFLDRVSEEVLVVLDEAYYEYVVDASYPDAMALLERYPNLMVLRTFSKIYGIAGLRIGYGIANPNIIEDLNRVRAPFNANRLAQRAAIAALGDQEFVKNCRDLNRQGIEQLYQGFDEMGLSYYPSQANFVLVKVGDGHQVFEGLLREGIIVRSGVPLGFPEYVRITVGDKEQNEKVLAALKKVLDK